jgi:pentatricopeptide repeat protein
MEGSQRFLRLDEASGTRSIFFYILFVVVCYFPDMLPVVLFQLSYKPKCSAFTIILRLYCRCGKIKLAEQTFLEMLELGLKPDEVACCLWDPPLCVCQVGSAQGHACVIHSCSKERHCPPNLSFQLHDFFTSK